MKANKVKLVARLIQLGEKKTIELKDDSFSTMTGRIDIPRPVNKKNENGDWIPANDLHGIVFKGAIADYVDKYGRNFYQDGEKEGKFIARQILIEGYFETYQGITLNPEPVILETEDGTLEIPKNVLEVKVNKVRFVCMSLDFLDYIENKNTDKEEKPKTGSKIIKVKKVTKTEEKEESESVEEEDFSVDTKDKTKTSKAKKSTKTKKTTKTKKDEPSDDDFNDDDLF